MEMKITLPTDEKGFTGRECPSCESYFKIKFGTGLPGEVPCHCSYCGHSEKQDNFFTKEQIKYIESIAVKYASDEIFKSLKRLETRSIPKGLIGIEIKVRGKAIPIKYYAEHDLEQEVKCDNCTLEYSIFGVFGYCPDCGIHNSLLIFRMNLDLIEKMLSISEKESPEIKQKLIENALEDLVSAFDGFGRELCKINSDKSNDPQKAKRITFQNIKVAKEKMIALFDINMSNNVSNNDWQKIIIAFEKRHLLAHKMGIVDNKYIELTDESSNILGKKVRIDNKEVKAVANLLRQISESIYEQLHFK